MSAVVGTLLGANQKNTYIGLWVANGADAFLGISNGNPTIFTASVNPLPDSAMIQIDGGSQVSVATLKAEVRRQLGSGSSNTAINYTAGGVGWLDAVAASLGMDKGTLVMLGAMGIIALVVTR